MLPVKLSPLGRYSSKQFKSISFSGADESNLYYENASVSNPSTFTISFWAKIPIVPTVGCLVKVGREQTQSGIADGGGVGIGIGGGNAFNTSYPKGNYYIILAETVQWQPTTISFKTPTQWHHYVLLSNVKSASIWCDGAEQKWVQFSGNILSKTPYKIFFGGYWSTTLVSQRASRFINCSMTRVAMWNRTLSASEIATDYADFKNAPTTTNGLTNYWPMNSESDFTTDKVGNANLTIGNGGITIENDSPFN